MIGVRRPDVRSDGDQRVFGRCGSLTAQRPLQHLSRWERLPRGRPSLPTARLSGLSAEVDGAHQLPGLPANEGIDSH